MARLPTKYDLSAPGSLRSGRAIATVDTSGIGRGMAAAGQAIAGLGAEITQKQNAVDIARAEAYKTEGLLAAQNEFQQDGDYSTFQKRAPTRTGEVIQKGAELIRDRNMRERWLAASGVDVAKTNDSIFDRGAALKDQAETVAFDDALEVNRRLYVDPDTSEEVKKRARADLEASIQAGQASGLLTPAQADQRRTQFIENADFSRGQLAIERDPSIIAKPLPKDVGDRAGIAMAFFQSRGYTKEQAAGIVGNLISESNLRPSGAVGDGGTAFGIAQWRGERVTRLKRFANANGRDWQDYETQLAFVDTELQNHETAAYNALKNAKTVDEATAAFISYERPRGWTVDNPRGGHNYSGRLKNAARVAGQEVNPDWFQRLSPENRQQIVDQADARQLQLGKQAAAQQKAAYDAHKDAMELSILTGKVTSDLTILRDPTLDDGDKASLLRTFRSEMEESLATAEALNAFQQGALRVDPYANDGRKTVDNMFKEITQSVPAEQLQTVTEDIVRQTGVVPQAALNAIRGGLSSQSVTDVQAAAQSAQRLVSVDPAALGRRDGGKEAQNAADDFSHYVNNLNMSPEDAARKLMDARDPQKQRDRKALEPLAKEFVKARGEDDVAALFNESFAGWAGNPALGFTPAQEAGIKAEYTAIAEDEFYRSNGDAELAKNRAVETMKRLYGVTDLTGSPVVMKHPPERYWPALRHSGGNSEQDLFYATQQLETDLKQFYPDADMGNVQLVTTPATDAMVKRGEMPGYSVLYKDKDGILQTIPGQLWRPDLSKEDFRINFQKGVDDREQQQTLENARRMQDISRQDITRQQLIEQDRVDTGNFMRGGQPITPSRATPPTQREQLQDQRQQLMEDGRQNLTDSMTFGVP